MHDHSNISPAGFPHINSGSWILWVLILCVSIVTSVAAQEQDQSTVIYDMAYFSQYSPVTLTDMIRNIPGGASILGRRGGSQGNNNRGFGSSDVQVLIDGRRMSGKVNNMSTALARIQAAQVERIELIRGNAEGLDIRNEGIIYNVILQEGANDSSSSFLDVGVTEIDGMSMEPKILASYNDSRGLLDYGLSYQYDTRPRLRNVDEDVLDPDRTPSQFRALVTEENETNHIYTGTLGYEFQNGTRLRLNAFYSDNEKTEDRLEDQFLVGSGAAQDSFVIEDGDFSFENQEFEIGGDLEFEVGNIGRLKTLFVVNRTENRDEIIQDTLANGASTRLFSSTADYDEGETIVRSAMTSSFGRHTLEYGAEAAFNTLDRTFAFNNDLRGRAIVEEDRYEVFVTHSILLTDKLSLQSALTGEFSTIFQDREGETNERSFRYLKPRIELRYDLTASDQFRLLTERTVSQLNLNDFVASRNIEDDIINFGNPDLEPESTWSYSLGYERRFANDGGSVEFKALYENISDHIGKILIGIDDSGVGNIGSAWKKSLEADLNTRFGFIGFPSAVLTVSYTYEDSETTDPFTGAKRPSRNSTPHYVRVSFRHDLENTNFAYGFSAHRRSGRLRQDVSLYEITDYEIHLSSAFAEYNVSSDIRVRFEAAHFLNEDGRTFDKTFYDGNIADGVIRRIDIQDNRVIPDFVLSLQATF